MAEKSSRPAREKSVKDYKKLHEEGFNENLFSPIESPIKTDMGSSQKEVRADTALPTTFTSGVQFAASSSTFEQEKKELTSRLRYLKEQVELKRLREEVQATEKELKDSQKKGMSVIDSILFDNLRKDIPLRRKARAVLSKLGALELSDDDIDLPYENETNTKDKHLICKSGITAKAQQISCVIPKNTHTQFTF